MNAVPFDTLKLARKLEASGMTGPMAAGTAEALAEAMGGSEVATKADIAGVRGEIAGVKAEIGDLRTGLKGEIADLRTELKAEIADLRTELKADIGGLRTEVKSDIAALGIQLRLEMEVIRRDVIIKFGSMLVIGISIMIATSRYFQLHP
jgi:hypothetical protein